jgi:hypothetical protein
MFARIATFEGVDTAEAAATMQEAGKRVEPILREMEGLQRATDLADSSSGKVLSIALFDSEENMLAAEKAFDEEMPRVLADLMEQWTGRRTSVERYEVVFDLST